MSYPTPVIYLQSVTKFAPSAGAPLAIFENMTVTIPSGAVCAVMGLAGSGKTTFLRLLCGKSRPDSGMVLSNARFSVIANTGGLFNPKLTGVENIHLSARRFGLSEKILTLAALSLPASEADWSKIAGKLSPRVRRSMETLLAALLPFDCYLLDNIERVPVPILEILFKILKAREAGIIFTTQNAKFARQFANYASVIVEKSAYAYDSVEEALNNYAG